MHPAPSIYRYVLAFSDGESEATMSVKITGQEAVIVERSALITPK